MKAEDVLLSGVAKKVLVIGDGLVDVNILGKFADCQDGCPKFVEESRNACHGGANNAAHSLKFSGATVLREAATLQTKNRFLVDGKIVWRHDTPLGECDFTQTRQMVMKTVMMADAVYLADYAKGFFDDGFMEAVIAQCNSLGIPVVCDPKRDPKHAAGAVLKCNKDFAAEWDLIGNLRSSVVTYGDVEPMICLEDGSCDTDLDFDDPPTCVNHVGAGDCFGAWLTLGLAHGSQICEAARLAHAAGRVYVQHLHNRPPRRHEVMKELDPVGGKLLRPEVMSQFRASLTGRVVFTNGCFRVPGAGHAWLFDWAKQQGDCLVVGVNSDVSAFRVKTGAYCLPLAERVRLIASQQSVDYVAVFGEDTPQELMQALGLLPNDLLVKGWEYAGGGVPGGELCEVRFAPKGPYPGHVTDLIRSIRG